MTVAAQPVGWAKHAGDRVALRLGDCRDILPLLPDDYVDAVVTDPPYELTNRTPDVFGCESCGRTLGGRDGSPEVCPRCGGALTRQRSRQGKGFMGKTWDGTGVAFDPATWAEVLRVLKPGGHLLAFGGTRTYHRLACAVEDAGFEIRDSVMWLYGQGFPKSLNVGKAIDKAAGATREVIEHRTLNNNRFATSGTGVEQEQYRKFEGNASITAPATELAAQWDGWGTALKPAWESVVCAVKPRAETGTIGSYLDVLEARCRSTVNGAGPSSPPTRPASPEVRTGSAPASAATPPEVEPVRTTPTGAVADSSAATGTSASEWEAETYSNTVTSWRRCWDDLCAPTSTSTTSTTTEPTIDLRTLSSSLSRLTDESTPLTDPMSPDGLSSLARAVDSLFAAAWLSWSATRTLTAIGPATSPTPIDSLAEGASQGIVVARKPFRGTVASNVLAHGTGALNIDGCRIGTTKDVPASVSKSNRDVYGKYQGETGTEGGHNPNIGRWPANVVMSHLPECREVGTRKVKTSDPRRADGTVNGALGTTGIYGPAAAVEGMEKPRYGNEDGTETIPAYECADGCAVAELDEQSGSLTSGRKDTKHEARKQDDGWAIKGGEPSYGDTGGASRFMYCAKASAKERPKVDGVAHATVKPLALMRWLVRLVTQPDGIVLDPFAGSGATVEACLLEGFRCAAIESEPSYLPLIEARVGRSA